MKLSVALCTYNGERFLSEQLSSIAAQTRQPDELIVCDDRSTDSTLSILRAFKRDVQFPVNIFVNETNLGSTRNFENAIKRCSGDVILLSDQDDVWLERKIEIFERYFLANPSTGLCFSDAELIDENSVRLDERLWDYTFPGHRRNMCVAGRALNFLVWADTVTGSTMAFRSSFVDSLTPTPDVQLFSHDGWIALTLAIISKVDFIPEPLVLYRIHKDQLIGIERGVQYKRSWTIPKQAYKQVIDEGWIVHAEFSKLAVRYQAEADPQRIDSAKEEIESLIAHFRTKVELPSSRLGRIIPVFNELKRGNYDRYSNGFRSALRDLLGTSPL